jgi:glycosyltransferase involved in cell wall biosynthesis
VKSKKQSVQFILEDIRVRVESRGGQGTKISWLSFQLLDFFLSKTAYIELSKHLAERGNQVDFFAIRSKRLFISDSPNMRLFAFPLRAMPFVSAFSYVILMLFVLPFYILKRKPDFVIIEPKFGSTFFSIELRLFPHSLRPTLILDIRSTSVEVYNFRDMLNSFWFKSSIITGKRTFDGFTVATKEMKKEICSEFDIDTKLMRVWENGVDIGLFSSEKHDGREMRRKLNLKDQFVVFYHGSFRFNGGIAETIKSIKLLKNKYPDILLFLLGSGGALPMYRQIIQENKIQDRVIIHPSVDYADVPKYIAIANVGIVPLPDIRDWRNQSPLKLVEYLAMKKPVIATDIPANRELIGENECGIYISSADPSKIAEAIAFAHDSQKLICKSTESHKAIAIEDYDWKNVAAKFESYLQEFAEKRNNAPLV